MPLAGDNVVGGVRYRFGGHANPQRTVQAHAWAAQDHGPFGCDALVLAAGPQTGALVGGLGHRLPLAPARAEMIVTEPLPLMPLGA